MLQLMPSRLSHMPPAFASVAVALRPPHPHPPPPPSIFFFLLRMVCTLAHAENALFGYCVSCPLESERVGMHAFVPFFVFVYVYLGDLLGSGRIGSGFMST